ncbi:DNA gyrase subunit A [Chlamydiifrater phoenicopteri]|uniref:DNA gyrase subunit A n=1 Tax=Chlamydiifrater phoenicopteri TaxID=2681469 RepID=UPI001BCE4058|nr:DNA gyrase subunit A [Chlamydiifrater phoenicopteri]
MQDVSDLFKTHFLHYASYVILERAIPHVLDGLKPVQRRLLWTLFRMDDNKMHKVANIAGRTMALHPHGDAPIVEALVVLANKGYLIDTQGNFGNPLTGDPHAAARYIEARLSSLAKETLFNTDLISFHPSYDGRESEPDVLPAKIPLLLLHGVDGIAVGMTTKIFPHNFTELLQAQIHYLENKTFCFYPDFPSGGIMDASNYQDGKGSITLRASIEIPNNKTLIIKELCPYTTTESLIRSIEQAAKRGLFKIDSIQDFSTEKPEIEIKLPKGCYAEELLPKLFKHTECEVTLFPHTTVIYEDKPIEPTLSEILQLHTDNLLNLLKKELEIQRTELQQSRLRKTVEYIFIKHKLYDAIRASDTTSLLEEKVLQALQPFHKELPSPPTKADASYLISIPIRKILSFNEQNTKNNLEQIDKAITSVEQQLTDMRKVTIKYLKKLMTKYKAFGIRKTKLTSFDETSTPARKEKTLF